MLKIGVIREGKNPPDSRVPLSPKECRELMHKFPDVELKVQSSPHRCFTDKEFKKEGIQVVSDVSDCDILLGVKEVPISQLIENKAYLFFSHTIKKQPYNRKLLQEVVRKRIRLVDYECMTDEKGIRVIAFGRWAGIVGAHEGLVAWGKKTQKLNLKRVVGYKDYPAVQHDYQNLKIPFVRIAITGDGRVAGGAVEVMDLLRIRRVTPQEYLNNDFAEAIYTQLSPMNIYTNKKGRDFDLDEFFKQPQDFDCDFKKWYTRTDLLINCIFWDPKAPRYFSLEDMNSSDFKIKTIADISCDINGSVPATLRATTIAEPVMGYDPKTKKEMTPFQPNSIDIMAVDNLPNELPRDASESFGEIMVKTVIPELIKPQSDMIGRATIAKEGNLTSRYEYLRDYLEGK